VEALEWITKVIVADPPLSMNRRKWDDELISRNVGALFFLR
jgi:hypothetical protein